jgi:hypothetical protein
VQVNPLKRMKVSTTANNEESKRKDIENKILSISGQKKGRKKSIRILPKINEEQNDEDEEKSEDEASYNFSSDIQIDEF